MAAAVPTLNSARLQLAGAVCAHNFDSSAGQLQIGVRVPEIRLFDLLFRKLTAIGLRSADNRRSLTQMEFSVWR